MSYASGGLIEATDYNNIVGTNTSVTSTHLNAMWAWGANSRGYGQTAVSQVSASSIVTATQWASLVNTLNSANTHINGSSSGLTANTAGQTITYVSSLQSKVSGVNSDRMLFASNSAVVAGTGLAYTAWTSASTSSNLVRYFGAKATFESADKARFFFNCGGRLKFNATAVASGSSRSTNAKATVDNLGGIALFAANTNGGRTGSGGTQADNITSVGYYQLTTSNVIIQSINSTSSTYALDGGQILVKTNGTQGSFGDNGTQVDFWMQVFSGSGTNAGGLSFDDSLSLTVTVSIDVSYPEVTNLSNTWGAVTVTQL